MSQADATNTRNTSRRLFLRSGSAAAVFGALATATASEADPIFAAIERHKAAEAAFEAACNLTDSVLAKQDRRKITKADYRVFNGATQAERAARHDLVNLAPRTRAGAGAALEYLIGFDLPQDLVRFAATLLKSPVLAG